MENILEALTVYNWVNLEDRIQFELDRAINDIGRNANAKIVLFDLSLRIGVALKK